MTVNEVTPTTEEVRDEWAYGIQEVDHDGNLVITLDEAFAQFDRWLSDHNRKIAAEALRGFVGSDKDYLDDRWCDDAERARNQVLRQLLAEADRIEQGGES